MVQIVNNMTSRNQSSGSRLQRSRTDSGFGPSGSRTSSSFNFDDACEDSVLSQIQLDSMKSKNDRKQSQEMPNNEFYEPLVESMIDTSGRLGQKCVKDEREVARLQAEIKKLNEDLLTAQAEVKYVRSERQNAEKEKIELKKQLHENHKKEYQAYELKVDTLQKQIISLNDQIRILEHNLQQAVAKANVRVKQPPTECGKNVKKFADFPNLKDSFKDPPTKRVRLDNDRALLFATKECQTNIQTVIVNRVCVLTPFYKRSIKSRPILTSNEQNFVKQEITSPGTNLH